MSSDGKKRQREDLGRHQYLAPPTAKRRALPAFQAHQLPQPSFAAGAQYPETREAHHLAVQALSERDDRQEPFKPGEDLHFLTRSKSYRQELVDAGTGQRHVSIEPQYQSGSPTGAEQEDHRQIERRTRVKKYRGSYPDWAARKFAPTGPEVAFDLKVPYRFKAVTYLSSFEKSTREEFDKRRAHTPPGTEQRLVLDLNSAGHERGRKTQQHLEVKRYVEAYKANEKREGRDPKFYADSIQYIYRGKRGTLKASKPYYVNPITVHHPVPTGYSKEGTSSKIHWFGNAGSVSSFSRRSGI
jgi:hypothetical protein